MNVTSLIEALAGFVVIIFVHELGHFLACKYIGVRVEAFSFGFGPCLRKKWGETEYRLSLIPLGGYVKIAGEELVPGRPPEPGEFYSKSVGQRSLVFLAGVVMNLLFGFIFFIAAYNIGVKVVPAIVGGVEPGSPAWQAGLKRGDAIERINDISPPLDFEDLKTAVVLSRGNAPLRLLIRRDGTTSEKVLLPEYDRDLGLKTVGIMPPGDAIVGEADSGRDLYGEKPLGFQSIYDAGLQPGDVITRMKVASAEESKAVDTPYDFLRGVDGSRGEAVLVWFKRDGTDRGPISIMPQRVGKPIWIGVGMSSNRIKAVRKESWAASAGLEKEDVVISVNEKSLRSPRAIGAALDDGHEVTTYITVQRGGTTVTLAVPPHPSDVKSEEVIVFDVGTIVDDLFPGFPAEAAGMAPGDEILSVGGHDATQPGALSEALAERDGQPVEIAWRRGEEKMKDVVVPEKRWAIIIPWNPTQSEVHAGIADSFRLGTRKAFQWIFRVYAMLRSILFGEVAPRNLNGFLVIGYVFYSAAERGIGTLLYFAALISVNLAVVNLLPIPVLDGGHLTFAIIEKVRGRQVSDRVREIASYIGLALLISLVVVAFWNDIRIFIFNRL